MRLLYSISLLLHFLIFKMVFGEDGNSLVNSVDSLSGKELKTAFHELLAGIAEVYRNSTGNVIGFGGYYYEQLVWISLYLNFSIDMELAKENLFGVLLPNGSWTGLRGQVQRGEVDLACSAFSAASFPNIFEMTIFVMGDVYGMLTQYPVLMTSNYGHYTTFSPQVWIALLISIIACTIVFKLIYFLAQRNNPGGFITTLSDAFIYIFATITNHDGYYRDAGHRSVGVMAFTWCLATFFIVNIYSSCLTSYMSLLFQRPDINTLSDLAASSQYQLITVKGGVGEIVFLGAQSGKMKQIGDKLRRCPVGVCSTLKGGDLAVASVLGGNFVAIWPVNFMESMIFTNFQKSSTCHLTIAQETMAYRSYYMLTLKTSPYSMELNRASLYWHSFGLQDRWMKKLVPTAPQCKLKYNSNGEAVQLAELARLKLEQFIVAFGVLFVGYFLALLQFLRERFIKY